VQGVDVGVNVGDDSEAHDYTMADLHSVRGRLTRCLGAGGRLFEQMECHEIVGNADGFRRGIGEPCQSLGGEAVVPLAQVRR
jgi:hypothetical protein